MNFFTELKEGLAISFGAIRAHKLRSTLTTLGIIIGVLTVTLMTTAIEGMKQAFMNSISALGADTLYVTRMDWFIHNETDWRKQRDRKPITLNEALRVEKLFPSARAVAPTADTMANLQYGDRKAENVSIVGTTDQFRWTSGITVAEGRFFTAAESDGARPVCVIGSQVATNLFPHESPVGRRLKIGNDSFEVTGVLEPQGEFLGAFSLDNQVVIPVLQFAGNFRRRPDYTIQVKLNDMAQLEEARYELRGVMRRVRGLAPTEDDDFAVNAQESFTEAFARVGTTMAGVGLFITGLSLFVGGIGIMNIMFVSVAERTKEIGIRKAIGARRRTILVQFLSEAACICLLGGLIALSIAWPATLLLNKALPARLSLPIVGLALLVALLTGVISGFVPAWRAARMNPVDALRSE